MANLAGVITGFGLLFDIAGVYLMARPYLQYAENGDSVIALLISGFRGDAIARGAERLAQAQQVQSLVAKTFQPALRGLGLLFVGFLLQLAGLFLATFGAAPQG